MILSQILQTNITRTVWKTVRRITDEILEVKGLTQTGKPLSESSEIFPGAEKRVSSSVNNEGQLAS